MNKLILLLCALFAVQCASAPEPRRSMIKDSKSYVTNAKELARNFNDPEDPVTTATMKKFYSDIKECEFRQIKREHAFWVNETAYQDTPKMYGVSYSFKTDCKNDMALVIYDVADNGAWKFRTVWWQTRAHYEKEFGEKYAKK